MSAAIGQKAPNLEVSEWVQGMPTNFDQEKDRVIVAEVFQVNCPGCFMHALPEAIRAHERFAGDGVRFLGIATAFEDYDKNTLENLKMLLETGRVIGDTKAGLEQYGQLKDGKLPYKIPFPVAMDRISKSEGPPSGQMIRQFILSQVPDFDSMDSGRQEEITQKARQYLEAKEYGAATFERFALRGTPSAIIVDRKGILRDVSFGQTGRLEQAIQSLISE